MKLYHWSTNIVTEPRIHGNCGYGFYLAKDKKYARAVGDLLHRVTVQPQNTCVFNDAEVMKHAFFNIDKEHYEEYLEQGYDSLAWFKNGKLAEFVVLKPEVIKNIEFIGSRLYEEVSISDRTFVPNVQWMSEKYDEMNAMLFNGKLGDCGFNVFTTGRGSGGDVLGWFKITGDRIKAVRETRKMFCERPWGREYINKDNFVYLCKPVIELNGNYRGTEYGFLSTLVHEMCHYYTYMEGWAPVQAHGREFRDIGSIVASRSNGMFTVQRIATAEQMSELELSDEMKAKKEKRLANKKASVSVVIVFRMDGSIELTITSNKSLVSMIKDFYEKTGEVVVVNNNSDVIEFLFSKGYRKNMRTWRYWNIQDKPWIDELKNMLFGFGNNIETGIDGLESEKGISPNKTFTIKTSTGTFECDASSEEELIMAIRQRFPKMNDETISKIISNPANYKLNEMKNRIKNIINEVIDEFIEAESVKGNEYGGDIDISPNMNLGKYSPFEISEGKRNVTRIRITALADMGRNKEMIMNQLLMLRKARNVGDEETVNNTVLSALRRYPGYIQFEIV